MTYGLQLLLFGVFVNEVSHLWVPFIYLFIYLFIYFLRNKFVSSGELAIAATLI